MAGAAAPAQALPGTVSVTVVITQNMQNVANNGTYPCNFSMTFGITVSSTGLRAFRVQVDFDYFVVAASDQGPSMSTEDVPGWIAVGPASLVFQVPARGALSQTVAVNGTVSEEGAAENFTQLDVSYATSTDAPLLNGGSGTIFELLFLADPPNQTRPEPLSSGGPLPAAGALAVGAVAAVAVAFVALAGFDARRRGTKLDLAATVRRIAARRPRKRPAATAPPAEAAASAHDAPKP